jgi:hypothetical protein
MTYDPMWVGYGIVIVSFVVVCVIATIVQVKHGIFKSKHR